MTEWVWLGVEVISAIHDEQLAEHGGSSGVRDRGLLESALAKPKHRAAYGEPDVAELAAAYGWGISRNHPFLDGNKRAAFVAVELFLELNGWQLVASDADCVMTMLRVAAGEVEEVDFADWIRRESKPRGPA
jgi:death-on-curing protein